MGIWPVKSEWWDAGMVICLGLDAHLHIRSADATATHSLLLQYIQIGFTFLVPAHPGSAGHSPGGR